MVNKRLKNTCSKKVKEKVNSISDIDDMSDEKGEVEIGTETVGSKLIIGLKRPRQQGSLDVLYSPDPEVVQKQKQK